ncbi:MAG: CDP-glycerol glycerophosphotransferase family protein [Firmicutes bacterium]|nr:CDP-glycerol glycerophosphotransferase family protein [Bacillota bacterium]
MRKIKKILRNFLKNHHKLRVIVRKVNTARKVNGYKIIAKNVKIDDKTILFETFMGRQYACNPRAIYEYMINDSRFDDFEFIWIFNDENKGNEFPALTRARIIKAKTREAMEAYAKAKYIITNSNLDNRVSKKKGQVIMQTWHGTPLKKLRCDITAEEGNVNNTLEEIRWKNDMDVVRYDYFLSPSPFASEKFISSFRMKELGIENIIAETGYPRNDLLFNYTEEDVRREKELLGIPADKKVILYAPTFRDNSHDGVGYVYDTHMDFDRLRRELGEEYVILFRAHYFIANSFDFDKYRGFVYDVSLVDDITPMYLITDILITDYSSVSFDFANLRRPIMFYMYDLDEYADSIRGFYFSVDEMPGDILRTEDELIDSIKNCDTSSFTPDERYERFNSKFNCIDDGSAAARATEVIFGER